MKILVIGGGGREHALAWKAAQSPLADEVYVAPGNAGTAAEHGVTNVDIAAEDVAALLAFAKREQIGLSIVGPEAPLVEGITDQFAAAGLRCFGPSAKAAQLEGSKAFSKRFLERHNIPTAAFAEFTELAPALAYIEAQGAPLVVKADGLAAGKGVVVAESVEQASEAARSMLEQDSFGDAGQRIVVEQFLVGEEASFIAMVANGHVLALASSQDHKTRDEGDSGPNTGGMGAYSPAPVIDEKMHRQAMAQVMLPTVRGLASEGIDYTGFLYAGLMIGADGVPRVLEFNCRFGDPETQPIMMRLRSDLVQMCLHALDGTLDQAQVQWDPRAALGVVLAANGYPASYAKGEPIGGLTLDTGDGKVFHAGTAIADGQVVTAGGRVLCAVGLGDSVSEAHTAAYQLVDQIDCPAMFCRRDIGHRAIKREQT